MTLSKEAAAWFLREVQEQRNSKGEKAFYEGIARQVEHEAGKEVAA